MKTSFRSGLACACRSSLAKDRLPRMNPNHFGLFALAGKRISRRRRFENLALLALAALLVGGPSGLGNPLPIPAVWGVDPTAVGQELVYLNAFAPEVFGRYPSRTSARHQYPNRPGRRCGWDVVLLQWRCQPATHSSVRQPGRFEPWRNPDRRDRSAATGSVSAQACSSPRTLPRRPCLPTRSAEGLLQARGRTCMIRGPSPGTRATGSPFMATRSSTVRRRTRWNLCGEPSNGPIGDRNNTRFYTERSLRMLGLAARSTLLWSSLSNRSPRNLAQLARIVSSTMRKS